MNDSTALNQITTNDSMKQNPQVRYQFIILKSGKTVSNRIDREPLGPRKATLAQTI